MTRSKIHRIKPETIAETPAAGSEKSEDRGRIYSLVGLPAKLAKQLQQTAGAAGHSLEVEVEHRLTDSLKTGSAAASENSYAEDLQSRCYAMEFALFRIEAVCKALDEELGDAPENEQASLLGSVIMELSHRALVDVGCR